MLCNKCNTATDSKGSVCKNCGSLVGRVNKTWTKVARVSVITLVVAGFAAFLALRHFDIIDFDFFSNFFGGGDSVAVVEETAPDEGSEGLAGDLPNQANSAEVLPSVTRSDEELELALGSIFYAVNSYVRDFSAINALFSNGGWLYNHTAGSFVDLELLIGLGYLGEEFRDENIFVLFLRPVDLAAFDEVLLEGFGAGERERMMVFLAYETPVGLGLFSQQGRAVIFREHLNKIFARYAPYNGEIWRPGVEDDVYWDVLYMIGEDDVFIRYLAVDDVYGFVAFTTSANPRRIRNYVFYVNYGDGGRPQVLARDLEALSQPVSAIGSIVPGFNFGLLPSYDIRRVGLLESGDEVFAELLEVLLAESFVQQQGEPLFVSVSGFFAYIVAGGGQSFLGQNHPAAGWMIEAVEGWPDAEEIMALRETRPPLYIVWQR